MTTFLCANLLTFSKIADGSGRALTFSREYGDKAHHTQRAGLTVESMPTLAECDDMIKRQRGVLTSMERIRVRLQNLKCVAFSVIWQ